MAKVKIKNPKKISKDLSKRFSAFTKSEAEMDKAATTMQRELVRNLRSGVGADDELLPDLKTSTIRRRDRLATSNRTNSKFISFFSNVTFSGQFVRSIKVIATKTTVLNRRTFTFFASGIHKGYTNLNGTKGKNVANSKIFTSLSKRGWKLAGVTESAKNKIRKQFIRFLRRK